jgi:hypothetical protein
LGLALVRDMRELREPSSAEEIEAFETDVLAGFVLARASAGLTDSRASQGVTISLILTNPDDAISAVLDDIEMVGFSVATDAYRDDLRGCRPGNWTRLASYIDSEFSGSGWFHQR